MMGNKLHYFIDHGGLDKDLQAVSHVVDLMHFAGGRPAATGDLGEDGRGGE
jgi:hypothetical protein